MAIEIKKAIRRALPLQIAFVGPQNSGKTLSALLFSAGLIAPNEKVVVIDTEHGRASLYADNHRIRESLQQGFDVIELDAPYHPKRFIEAVDVAERAGYKVCVIDSSSDSWDGQGGCADIAESLKNMWNIPKLWNKRLMTRIALSDMHIICCLKAQEKTKIVEVQDPKTGKQRQEYINLGMQPICEKNFFYPMLLAFSCDPVTHFSTVTKCHDDLAEFFKTPRLITKADGEGVRLWNGGAVALGPYEQLLKRAQDAAERGVHEYQKFFENLNKEQRKSLVGAHDRHKRRAEEVDRKIELEGDGPPPEAKDGQESSAA